MSWHSASLSCLSRAKGEKSVNDNRNNHSNNSRARSGPAIKSWETLETIVDKKDYIGKIDIGVKVTVDQPEFESGHKGYKRLNAEIRFGRHFIRMNTKGFMRILEILDEHREAIDEAVTEVRADNDVMRREQQERRESRGNRSDQGAWDGRPGGVGSGLSRFTKTPKRDRKRKKKGFDRHEAEDR